MDEQGTEDISFKLIASAGDARSLAFSALSQAKQGEFEAARSLMDQSKEAALKAHHVQTELLTREASGDHLPVDVLLVHAQDHLMCAMLAQELVQELICVYEQKAACDQ